MARPGPKPKPTALKILHGETRRSRLPSPGPVPQLEEIRAPSYLDADARRIWDELAPLLEARGVLTSWDTRAFAVYCSSCVLYERAMAVVNELGPLVPGGAKGPQWVKNPAVQIARDTAQIIARFAGLFGLSASDRVGLEMAPRNDHDSRNDLFSFGSPFTI